jgi:hypothetical protein
MHREPLQQSFTQHLRPFEICPTVDEVAAACSADHKTKKLFFDRLIPEFVQQLLRDIESVEEPLRQKFKSALNGPIKRFEVDHQMRNGIAS